jgi:hypothetical protein
LAPPPRALVAVVAQGVAQVLAADRRVAAAVRLVRLQVAVVLAPRRVPLQPEPEVAALLLVQGLVASQSLRSR